MIGRQLRGEDRIGSMCGEGKQEEADDESHHGGERSKQPAGQRRSLRRRAVLACQRFASAAQAGRQRHVRERPRFPAQHGPPTLLAFRSNPAPAAGGSQNSGSSGADGSREPELQEIEARVTDLRETVPNAYLITLDNGQVWRQTVPKTYALREGSPVRIYYSRWRAYRLTNDQLKGFIQVERVR